jgi:D-hydroxyproline dehydrogenase subunit beta
MPDVTIIGGGIIGAACAYELATRGATVTLVERDHLAAHASGRNHGLWLLPDDDVNVEMARISLDVYREVASDAPLDVRLDAEPVGTVMAAMNAAEVHEAEALVERVRKHGIAVDDIAGPAEIRDHEPGLTRNVAGAWLVHDGFRLDPGALTVALALRAANQGAEIRHHSHVRALAIDGERVHGVVTDDGLIGSDVTIVAAGPWSTPLLEPVGVHLPIVSARGWLVRVAPPVEDVLTHLVIAPGAHAALRGEEGARPPSVAELMEHGPPPSEVGSLLNPLPGGGAIVVGSSRQIVVTPEPSEEQIVSRLLAAATELVPAIAEADVLSSWWGIRPLTPDERPLIGIMGDGLAVATGHGSEGVILGAGTARLLAAQLAGEPPPLDPGPFDPLRF